MGGQRLSTEIKPFRLKWAGGKRWLAEALVRNLGPASFADGLCEPFAGGAALSFAADSPRIHLGDTNFDLVETYRAIKSNSAAVAKSLAKLTLDEPTYLRVRAEAPVTRIDRAVRMIYLNRTAFNGLWRVNQQGLFNVPFGCKPETRMPGAAELLQTAAMLKRSKLEVGDFERVAMQTLAGTVYFDPPYTVAHNHNGFVRYNERIFSWSDQLRLASVASELADAGRTVVVSNADHADLRNLYRGGPFKLYRVRRPSNLAANADMRGSTTELLAISRNVRLRSLPTFATRIS